MRLNFQLMNQDEIILQFDYVEESVINYYFTPVNQISDTLPYGFTDIETWLGERKAPKHRKHIKALLPGLTMEIYEDKHRFGEYVKNQLPRLETDFIGVAKYFMNTQIESDLRRLLDSLCISDVGLEEWRMVAINDIISNNIIRILQ